MLSKTSNGAAYVSRQKHGISDGAAVRCGYSQFEINFWQLQRCVAQSRREILLSSTGARAREKIVAWRTALSPALEARKRATKHRAGVVFPITMEYDEDKTEEVMKWLNESFLS